MRILDTHLHLVYPDRFTYAWLDQVPSIRRPWSVEDYFAEAEKLDITSAIFMEVDVADGERLAEADFMADLHPNLIGAIASARPEDAGFPAELQALAARPYVRGIRRILHEAPDVLSQSDLFADNIKRLAAHGLTFDLCVRDDQLALGRALVDKAPEVQFVLDHCGVPRISQGILDPWRDEIRQMAERPNVVAKISGVVAYSGDQWTVDDLRPYVEHVIEQFGWDRVVWGSDHPVCCLTANLTRWVQATQTLLRSCSDDERSRLLHRNAERIYRVGGGPGGQT